MSELRCTICGKSVPREENPYKPFCSRRCQQLDLGRWLDERYGLPWEDPNKDPDDPDQRELPDRDPPPAP